MESSIQFVKRKDGVKIAYSRFGKGPPLVCPAPWVTSLSYVFEDPFAKEFWGRLAQDVTVISYDKHGCGQSDRDRMEFTLETELLDLETVVSHVGLEEFNLLGSSMAGPVAVTYASRNPKKVNRLVLYGTYAIGENLATESVRSALVSFVKASWGLGSKALADIFVPGANREELQSVARFQRESASPETAAKLLELSYLLDVSGPVSGIDVPTLVLHREGDKVIPVAHGRELAAAIPKAHFKVLKGKYHPWWYGKTEEIINEIVGFVRREESRRSVAMTSEVTTERDLDGSEIVEQATILFSDIVSSTELVTELGDAAARELFMKHDKIIRDQIEKYGGRELQNLGDGFMLSFQSASGAIRCACSIQREISEELTQIKVRMGINTGEVIRREGRHPFGQAVVLASRIASKAKGDEILLSDVTRQLAAGSRFHFTEKGRFKPKGFTETIRFHEVSWKE